MKIDSQQSSFRSRQPLKDKYISNQLFFFLQHMFSDTEEIYLYLSLFAVIRDISCFFFS
jgi:hypothetical protein